MATKLFTRALITYGCVLEIRDEPIELTLESIYKVNLRNEITMATGEENRAK